MRKVIQVIDPLVTTSLSRAFPGETFSLAFTEKGFAAVSAQRRLVLPYSVERAILDDKTTPFEFEVEVS